MPKFKGRLYLIGTEDPIHGLEVFSEELEPMAEGTRPLSEWAEESISQVSVADLYSDLQLDPEKCFQVVFEGEITGSYDHNGEYDEELYLTTLVSEEIPQKYLEAITDPFYDTIQVNDLPPLGSRSLEEDPYDVVLPTDVLSVSNGCLRVNNTPFVVIEPDESLMGVDSDGKLNTWFRGLTNVWEHSDIKGYYA